MEPNLSIHVKMFNDKVRAMNQTNKRELHLSAEEARNLHTDIFALLAHIAELSGGNQSAQSVDIVMDGGSFK